ncbi:MAG TPA: type II toxin-antitoxin system RelE/ParE family toxin [Candidatus Rifleibacterium sp.]|nr:type II toxin-antitoxin system RelE/ParE family toxin [Candidatus Rifleibacterium sp.]
MSKYDVLFFEKEDGEQPAKTFVASLDSKLRAKAVRLMKMLADNGPDLREPYLKHLCDGIFEIKPKVATNVARVLYFFFVGRKIVFTNGFIKKTQETPPGEIERAKAYRREYLKRES